MISEAIINAVIRDAMPCTKDEIIKLFIKNISYSNDKVLRILEMITAPKNIKKISDVNIYYIENHLDLLTLKYKDFDIKDIKVVEVNNINGIIYVSYKYKLKDEEAEDDSVWKNGISDINYINNPELLK